ncbi:sucrose-6F-phosphate phosphohydrolase family protein [Cryptosporidium muris RN66]|uniref:Sucrose-6F-phosphate phosphohydrolase family protein n=1 Tax=Cryptosporidium muris (strain RN66) TaxID=441375 RepID=B6AIA5_CRYMR|nr:sucrose-6F-phosphate phosphohydrolase family protein [Cryptosporidium muris RN66]EEA07946.1 sucrose-6F-phosphate phosphohydrolase family protein [Cryptosporidium muris RN66]|eukprot:XP_002142295.1 sucrose-6F-phosphate phosphohydrolase family protein [Cryptosporidium muris RN66]
MVNIKLFYYSGWDKVLLYHESQNNIENKIWEERPLKKVENWINWHYIEIELIRTHMEFVMTNDLKSEWDNPPRWENRKNYIIYADNNLQNMKICLKDGILSIIEDTPPIVLITDLDGTLLGSDKYLEIFQDFWIRQHAFKGSILIYSTGRNLKDFLKVSKEKSLIRPDYAICGVGTEIYTFPGIPMKISDLTKSLKERINDNELSNLNNFLKYQDEGLEICNLSLDNENNTKYYKDLDIINSFPIWCPNRLYARPLESWFDIISCEFNHELVKCNICNILNLENIEYYINGNKFHDPFRLSISICSDDIISIIDKIQINNKNYKYAISGIGKWRYLDILPLLGGKDNSVMFLYDKYIKNKITIDKFLVCGDSGNDAHMFSIPNVKTCCVNNAQQDLKDYLVHGDNIKSDLVDTLDNAKVTSQGLLLIKIMEKQDIQPPSNVYVSTLSYAAGIGQALMYYGFNKNIPIFT